MRHLFATLESVFSIGLVLMDKEEFIPDLKQQWLPWPGLLPPALWGRSMTPASHLDIWTYQGASFAKLK